MRGTANARSTLTPSLSQRERGLPRPVLLAATALVLLAGCAGYQIGPQSLFPQHIHTVSVPVFDSVSFRRNLGERLTEAVAKEIERRSTYKVVSGPGADSVLSGRISSESKRVVVGSRTGDPRELQVNLVVEVSWTDCRGNAIRQMAPVPVPPELVDVSGTANVVPEFGQSIATSQQQAIQRLAEQIVNLMETPW